MRDCGDSKETQRRRQVYDVAKEVRVKRGKAGVALPANVRFYDAPDSHQHNLGSIRAGDRDFLQPINALLY